MATVTDTIESRRDPARALTEWVLKSSNPDIPRFALAISDYELLHIREIEGYPTPEERLWTMRKQWEIENKIWEKNIVPQSYYPQYYTSGSATGQTVTINYDNSTQAYPQMGYIPVQMMPAPMAEPEPKELTPLEWLDQEVDAVRELAWAA